MNKKVLLSMFVTLTVLLSGCGSGGGSKDTSKGNVDAPVKQDPVELVIYYPFPQDWDSDKFMATFGDPIQKKYPYITVKYIVGGSKGNSISELVAAGQKLDVVAASIGATPSNLLDNNLQYDISPIIKKFNYDLSKLEPSMVDIAKKLADGGVYGLPVLVPPSTIYYNKDLFDKFGVSYPKDGATWDDYYEMNKKLTRYDGGIQYYGFGSSHGHTTQMNQFSIPIVDTKAKKSTFLTDDRWKPYIENFVRMYKVSGYENLKSMSEPNERNQFFKDRTFAMFSAITALEPINRLEFMNWDLATYPVFKDKPDVGPQAYPTYFYITSASDHKDAAFQAISYLTTDEFQTVNAKKGTFVPISTSEAVLRSFGQDEPFYKGKNIMALKPKKYAIAGSVNKYNSMANGKLDIKKIITGGIDINGALRDAAEAADKAIQEQEALAK